MNIRKDKKHPQYICDKCKNKIRYIDNRGFVGLNRYYKNSYKNKREIVLCTNCERKFIEWLNIREIPTFKEMIDNFPKI